MTPSSNPLKGSTVRIPPKPIMLKRPIAHDGHAGATTLTKRPDVPTPMLDVTCLLIRKIVIDKTMPASTDMMIKRTNDKGAIDVVVPVKRKYKSLKEKSEIIIL